MRDLLWDRSLHIRPPSTFEGFLLHPAVITVNRSHTFVPAQLDVGEQADLDDLPQQAEHQVLPAFLQVLSSDVHYVAADGRGGVQSQV